MKTTKFKYFIYNSFVLAFLLFFTQCRKTSIPPDNSDTVTISKLDYYYGFLEKMKSKGYVFFDFKTFLNTDTSDLPKLLLVIRHDIHYPDIPWAYPTLEIEKMLIGNGHSTFYVMLNNPLELNESDYFNQDKYLKLIQHLDSSQVDVQPHISPIDMYIVKKHPIWDKYSFDSLKKLFAFNYKWEINKTGRRIIIKAKDVFDINDINNALLTLLTQYNVEWTKQTKIHVQGYSAHGTTTVMNKVLNNAYLLDQFYLLNAGIYQYDTYNSKIFNILTYLSDNSRPPWMTEPDSIPNGKYQLLMHPNVWAHITKVR